MPRLVDSWCNLKRCCWRRADDTMMKGTIVGTTDRDKCYVLADGEPTARFYLPMSLLLIEGEDGEE